MGLRKSFYADVTALHPEVTGSCLTMRVQFPNGRKTNFIVDCGLFQEKEKGYNSLNKEDFPFRSENIEFALITHNHADHMGRLPMLIKGGFNGFIYTTESTAQLLPISLKDSYQIMKEEAKNSKTKQPYCEYDVEEVYNRLKPCKLEETVYVSPYIKVTFFDNGHLIGAAMILVQISYPGQEDINYLFTGDYNNKNIFFNIPKLRKAVKRLPLTIIQESTYGTTNSDEVTECFEENVLKCIRSGGTVVNMAFSLGRFQEILYKLKTMQDEGKLSTDIPIFADGTLGLRYTALFSKEELEIKPEAVNFLPQNLCFVNKENRTEILESEESKIIVTTSGMGTYGPAPQYIIRYIKDKKSLIQFTGFTTDGTLGSRLKMAQDGDVVTIGGMVAIKKARVEYTTEFSAHAKADEMIEFLQQFEDIKLILINHGETSVKEEFAKRILQEVNSKNVGILNREYLYRVGPYGFIKTMSTKFE